MSKIFREELLLEAISKEKAEARKQGKIAGNSERVSAKQMLSASIAVINSDAFVVSEVSEDEQSTKENTNTSLTLESVRELITSAIAPLQSENSALRSQIEAVSGERTQLSTQLEQTQSQIKELESERDRYRNDAQVLHDIGKLSGVAEFPMVNTLTSVNDSPRDLAEELQSILQDRDLSKINHDVGGFAASTGMIYATQRDPSYAGRLIQDSFREARAKGLSWKQSQVIKDVETWAKKNGLLSGRVTNAAGPTTGASGSVVNAFLDVLSTLMRETHSQSNIFWQFVTQAYDATSAPGKNILVPRFNALPQPTTLADYILADFQTYNSVGLAVGTSSDSQNLEMTTVPIDCKQWGIGRGTSIGTRPVFIPEFHNATSLVDLMDALESRLMRNYYQFEELLIRSEYEKATTIAYNDAGGVTSVPADVAVGDGGHMTREFLTSVYSAMFAAQMPTFPDGSYALALNPTAGGQLKLSYDKILAAPSLEQIESVSNMLRQVSGLDFGRVSGYLGFSPDGFHLFSGNSFGVGAAGATPTVQNTTFAAGVGARVTNDSFAFGPGAVGRGIALPVEVRSQEAPFQLGSSYIWVERGGVAPMDLDSTLSTGQQTRCWRLRTTRAAV